MISERIKKIREISENYDEFLKYIKVQEATYTPDPKKSAKLRHAEAFCAVMDQMNTNYIPGSLIASSVCCGVSLGKFLIFSKSASTR